MTPCRMTLLLGALLASSAVGATTMSLNAFPSRTLPVLVQVDSHGHVRDVSPAAELSPVADRMLRDTLDRMITQPAHEHGRPVASQLVVNLGLQADPRPDGRYDARFVYLSSSPVPAGSWYWVHIDGHRLALANRNDRTLEQPWPPAHRWTQGRHDPQPTIQHVQSRPFPIAPPTHPTHHP